jgi:hypothetical protein
MKYPPMTNPEDLMVNQMTLKTSQTGPNNRLSQASKKIKELQKI